MPGHFSRNSRRSRSTSRPPRAPRTTTTAISGNTTPYQSLQDDNQTNGSFERLVNAATGGDVLNTSVDTINTSILIEQQRERDQATNGREDPEGVVLEENYPTWLEGGEEEEESDVNTTCPTDSHSFDSSGVQFAVTSNRDEEEDVVPRPPGSIRSAYEYHRGRSTSRKSSTRRSSNTITNNNNNYNKRKKGAQTTPIKTPDAFNTSRASTTSTIHKVCWRRCTNWLLFLAILLVGLALAGTAMIILNMYRKSNSGSSNNSNALTNVTSTTNVQTQPPAEDDDFGMLISVEQLSEAPTKSPTLAPSMRESSAPSIRGSSAPTGTPSTVPTKDPSATPTSAPSASPTEAAPSTAPTMSPTSLPSMAPSLRPSLGPTRKSIDRKDSKYLTFIEQVVEDASVLTDVNTPQGRALEWLELEDDFELDILEYDEDTDSDDRKQRMLRNLYQRFAVVTLDFALHNSLDQPKWSFPLLHVCIWPGTKCNAQREINGINWARMNLTGTIPPELGLLTNLVALDLAQNQLKGHLDPLYKLEDARDIFVFDNQLTGPLKKDIEACTNLTKFMAGHNALTGQLPSINMRSLNWFNVHHNEFTGSIPANMSLGKTKIFDISNNRIGSTIPANFVDEIVPNVRHLHIENNLLNGTVPENFVNLGKGRVLQIYMNDNQFSGAFPTRFEEVKHLTNLDLSNNLFTARLGKMCRMSVFDYGELIEMRADCRICNCDRICRTCYDNVDHLYEYDDDTWIFDDDSLFDDLVGDADDTAGDDDLVGADDDDDDDTTFTETPQLNIINGDDDDDDNGEVDDDSRHVPNPAPRPKPATTPRPRDDDDVFTVISEMVVIRPAPGPAPRPAPAPQNNNDEEEGFDFGTDGDDGFFFQGDNN